MLPSKRSLIDLAERTGATFGQAFLATITVQRNVTEKTALYTALAAGGLAVAKYLLAAANTYLRKTPAATP